MREGQLPRPRPRPRPRPLPLPRAPLFDGFGCGLELPEIGDCGIEETLLLVALCPFQPDSSHCLGCASTFGVGGGVNPPNVIMSCRISSSFSSSTFFPLELALFFISTFQLLDDTDVQAMPMSCELARPFSRTSHTVSGSPDSRARVSIEVDEGREYIAECSPSFGG